MQVLIDYLVLTSKKHSVDDFIYFLGLKGVIFLDIKSFYGYKYCKYYNGIKIHFSPDRQDVCIDLSGKGCRTLEEINKNDNFDWFKFLQQFQIDIIDKNIHISRLDVCADDFINLLDFRKLYASVDKKKYICKSDYVISVNGSEQAIYFGSPRSDRRLRIYNKGLQMGYPDGVTWVRCELQLRNDNATSFFLNWCFCKDIGQCYCGVLIDYLRFTNKTTIGINKNYQWLVTVGWWQVFTQNIGRIKQCYLQGFSYDLETCKRYIKKQCSSSLKTLLAANGGDLSELLDMVERSQYNKQQKELLNVL